MVGVYRLYKLARLSEGTFDRAIRAGLERDLHVITNDYAERVNAYSHINGLQYEKDEKATKLYFEKKPFKAVKEYTEFEEVKEEVKEISETSSVALEDLTLAELRDKHKEVFGKNPKFGTSKEQIIEALNNAN